MRSAVKIDLGNGDNIASGEDVDDVWIRLSSRNGQSIVVTMNLLQAGRLKDQLSKMKLAR